MILGIAFLYALWHSASVRSQLVSKNPSLIHQHLFDSFQMHGDVDSTISAATYILGDLINKCPPAEACRDAFERMSKATLKMCLSTTGFGSRAANSHPHFRSRVYGNELRTRTRTPTPESEFKTQQNFQQTSQPPPGFDMDLQVLYPENTQDGRSYTNNMDGWSDTMQPSLASTSSSPPVRYQGRSNAPAQQREYYSNTAQPQSPLFTNEPFMTPNVPNDFFDFNTNEFDFLAMNDESMAMYQGNSGLHLGYDAEHDWSEGAQTELFGDFFFGGVGNAANAAQ